MPSFCVITFWGLKDNTRIMRENTLGCIAYEYLKQKAETGDQEAQYNLALYYKQSLCTPMNLTESLKWMFQSAQKGHTKAQYELGQYHMKLIGQELIKDSEGNVYDAHAIQARFWYKSSAEKGLKEAQSKLGFCYIHAIGGSEDLDKAFFWFQKSALQNEPFALYALGVFNLLGYKEHTKDIEKAKEYFLKGIEYGYGTHEIIHFIDQQYTNI